MSPVHSVAARRRRLLQGVGILLFGSIEGLSRAASKERVIRIVARKFEFVPQEIHVAEGETVILRLTAPEVPMGFSLPDFHTRVDIVPGREASLRLTPDRSGSFTFVCDVFCGSGHEDMSGTLIVSPRLR